MSYQLTVPFDSPVDSVTLARHLQAAYDANAVSGTFNVHVLDDNSSRAVFFLREAEDDYEYVHGRLLTAETVTDDLLARAAADQLLDELTERGVDLVLVPILDSLSSRNFTTINLAELRELQARPIGPLYAYVAKLFRTRRAAPS